MGIEIYKFRIYFLGSQKKAAKRQIDNFITSTPNKTLKPQHSEPHGISLSGFFLPFFTS